MIAHLQRAVCSRFSTTPQKRKRLRTVDARFVRARVKTHCSGRSLFPHKITNSKTVGCTKSIKPLLVHYDMHINLKIKLYTPLDNSIITQVCLWYSATSNHISKLERTQNTTLWRITSSPYYTLIYTLHNTTDIPLLQEHPHSLNSNLYQKLLCELFRNPALLNFITSKPQGPS